MKNKTKVLLLLNFTILLSISFIFTGCNNTQDTAYDPANYLIEKTNPADFHAKRLTDKESPYTMCFENTDGTNSLYIFTSPIAYYDDKEQLKAIDNTLTKTKDKNLKNKGYELEQKSNDIQSYFPKDLKKTPFLLKNISNNKNTEFEFKPNENFIDMNLKESTFLDLLGREHSSAIYQDKKSNDIIIEYIPTSSGITANIIINEKPENEQIDFYISQQDKWNYDITDNEYILFKENETNEPKAIIRASHLKDANGICSYDNKISVKNGLGKCVYSIKPDTGFLNDPNIKYPLSLSTSFELYRSTTPDTTVYSDKPDENLYLADYAVLGDNKTFGSSINYIRFRVNYVFKSYAENVKSAEYVSTILSKDQKEISVNMLRLKDIWSSTVMNWNSRSKTYDVESTANISSSGRYGFDITKFIKACVKDDKWDTESCGLAMAAQDNSIGSKIISTGDNALYRPYVRIDFYDLPWTYERVFSINPDG